MSIKDRLNTHRDLLRKIQHLERQLEDLREDLPLPTTIDLSRASVQGGEKSDHLPLKLHQIETISRELDSLYVLRDQEHDELWKTVHSLASVTEVFVLRSHHFSLQPREEIARQLFENEEDFKQRRKYYLSRVSQLRSRAIRKLCNAEQAKAKPRKAVQSI